MSAPSVDNTTTARRALEAFVVDNADLDRLEILADRFNLFEVIGFIRQELKHSDFLGYLLDPGQNHQLGDVFTRRFLQRVLVTSDHVGHSLSPIHLDTWDLGHLKVRREWCNIDILLVDSRNKFVVVVENKIDSGEHSDQLARYLRHVQDDFPAHEWRRLAIFLTPNGADPSEPEYLPAAYRTVADVVETVAESRRAALDPAVHIMMTHYAGMLRRHIVADSEIADLCRLIYSQHKRAIDLIIEHRPDHLADVHAILVGLIKSTPELIADKSEKQRIRFAVSAWEGFPRGEGWTPTGRVLLFQFDNFSNSLDLTLWIGPASTEVRQRFIDLARNPQSPFMLRRKNPETEQWSSIFRRSILRAEDYDSMTSEALEQHIRNKWAQFVADDLLAIVDAMKPDALGYTEHTQSG